MNASFYLTPFLTAFLLTILSIVALRFVFARYPVPQSRQGDRHTHKDSVLRFGGVALVVAFVATILTNHYLVLTKGWWGVIIASIMLLILGLWDDIRELSWKNQLAIQIVAGAMVFAFGIRLLSLRNPFGHTVFFDAGLLLGVSAVLTILWIILVMNAMNWADGIDGLCGGVSFIGFATIFFLSLRPEVNQPPVAILALVLAGVSLGFLIFNFYPAKILAGTSGSWFLGFMLAVLAVFSGTKIATAILVLALPLFDALWVIFDRFRSGVSIFAPDQRHLHHRLRKLGWSSRAITAFLYTLTILIAIIALHTDAMQKLIALLLMGVCMLLFFIWIQKQTA